MGDSRRYWVGFNLVAGIGSARLSALLNAFGNIEAAWKAPASELERVPGIGEQSVRALLQARSRLDLSYELGRIDDLGLHILTWADETYPSRLREIDSPPPVLYALGDVQEVDRHAVAVVGTRLPSAYGLSVTEEIAGALAAYGVTVVSGMARGIDAAAHRSTLDSGGRTLGVLGSGMDRIYPSEHRRLADAIAASGAVFTEYPLGTRPEPGNFPARNRLIAGLSLATVVVEAAESSGALITAEFAAEQGRDVFAVPGSIMSRTSRGPNELIRSGATPLLSPQDLIDALELELVARREQVNRSLPEDETERRVMEALSSDPLHIDELGARAQLAIEIVGAALAVLEIKGLVRHLGGMVYVRTR